MDRKFTKKCTIIVLISTILLLFLSWIDNGFSIHFFTSWNFTLEIVLSFVFSIIFLPFIIYFSSVLSSERKPLTVKRKAVSLIICVGLILFDIILNKLLGVKESSVNYAIDAIIMIVIFML